MRGQRGADDLHRHRRAGAFAEPHIEREQRLKTKSAKQATMRILGRAMPREAVIDDAWCLCRERCNGRAADEPVEHDRNTPVPRGEHRPRHRRNLAPAEPAQRFKGICACSAMQGQRSLHQRALAGEDRIADARAPAHPCLGLAA